MKIKYKLIVTANKLNKRSVVPSSLPDKNHLLGVVFKGFEFVGEEVENVPNKNLGTWYKDRDGNFYWGGGLKVLGQEPEPEPEDGKIPNQDQEEFVITPGIKKKIEQVINVFETGTATGNYAALVKLKDYRNPKTGALERQITYGRSQTTEFGHLKTLIRDYIEEGGKYAHDLQGYLPVIGKPPTLANDAGFCNLLVKAGADKIMQLSQDRLFDTKYYHPAYAWFDKNGFNLPLSLLVIYDSFIHSGSILGFLRKRFSTAIPANGGKEEEWISDYINVRRNWLQNHSNPILRNTVYRMDCFVDAIKKNNWLLAEPINAHGVIIK